MDLRVLEAGDLAENISGGGKEGFGVGKFVRNEKQELASIRAAVRA